MAPKTKRAAAKKAETPHEEVKPSEDLKAEVGNLNVNTEEKEVEKPKRGRSKAPKNAAKRGPTKKATNLDEEVKPSEDVADKNVLVNVSDLNPKNDEAENPKRGRAKATKTKRAAAKKAETPHEEVKPSEDLKAEVGNVDVNTEEKEVEKPKRGRSKAPKNAAKRGPTKKATNLDEEVKPSEGPEAGVGTEKLNPEEKEIEKPKRGRPPKNSTKRIPTKRAATPDDEDQPSEKEAVPPKKIRGKKPADAKDAVKTAKKRNK